MYQDAIEYFNKSNNNNNYLLSLCLGGGNYVGAWNNDINGPIYSVYEAVTQNGQPFKYETNNGKISGIGKGTLQYLQDPTHYYDSNNYYNSLTFDIENRNGLLSGSDFIKLFNYIKTANILILILKMW